MLVFTGDVHRAAVGKVGQTEGEHSHDLAIIYNMTKQTFTWEKLDCSKYISETSCLSFFYIECIPALLKHDMHGIS